MGTGLHQLIGSEVLVKFSFLPQPVASKIAELEAGGIWFEGGGILEVVGRMAPANDSAPNPRTDLSRHSWVFVPLQNIEWLAS
jgi:hypothetical protein